MFCCIQINFVWRIAEKGEHVQKNQMQTSNNVVKIENPIHYHQLASALNKKELTEQGIPFVLEHPTTLSLQDIILTEKIIINENNISISKQLN